MHEIIETWRDRIYRLKKKKITAKIIADKANISKEHVSALVNQKATNPHLNTIVELESAIQYFENIVREMEGQ